MDRSSSLDVGQVTRLLERIDGGEEAAREELMRVVYDDLRAVARNQLAALRGSATLQPTALVNETYLRLVKQRQRFDNRSHFFAIATTLMIRVLRDHHRRHLAGKRGAGADRVDLDTQLEDGALVAAAGAAGGSDRALAMLDALERLEALDARKAEVVKLRVLWGLTHQEIAETLSVGRATVDRDWRFARVWLRQHAGDTGA